MHNIHAHTHKGQLLTLVTQSARGYALLHHGNEHRNVYIYNYNIVCLGVKGAGLWLFFHHHNLSPSDIAGFAVMTYAPPPSYQTIPQYQDTQVSSRDSMMLVRSVFFSPCRFVLHHSDSNNKYDGITNTELLIPKMLVLRGNNN